MCQKPWSERSSTQVPRAGFRVLAPVSGSNIFLRSGTNLGKFDCQMGFALETGQEMGFFCLFRLDQRIVGTGGLNRHGRMSKLRVAGFDQFANPGWSGWSLQAGGRKVGLVGCSWEAGVFGAIGWVVAVCFLLLFLCCRGWGVVCVCVCAHGLRDSSGQLERDLLDKTLTGRADTAGLG